MPAQSEQQPERRALGHERQDLTVGPIWGHIVRLAIPSALTNLLTYSTTLVDMIWLGRLSPSAIAAVATFNYFWFLFALLNQIVGNGSVALISRSYGSGDREECKNVFGQTFAFKLVVSVIVAAIGLLGQRWAYTVFGAEGQVLELAVIYGTIQYAATPLKFSTFTLKTGLRAIGDMRMLLWISAATAVINLVVDPFFIFETVHIGPLPAIGWRTALVLPGAGMGIAGAAWGTVLAFVCVFILTLIVFTSGRTLLKMHCRHFCQLGWETARKILVIGFPPALGNSLQHFASLFIGASINTYGTAVFAAQGVNQILVRLVRFSIMGINMASITLVGQNLGAKKPQRSEQTVIFSYAFITILMFFVGAGMYLATPALSFLFVPGGDAESVATREWVVRILHINCFLILPLGLTQIARAAFQGSGDTKPPLWATLISTFCIQLPLILGGVYLAKLPDPKFIWWVEAASYAVSAAFLYFIFRKGHWKKYKV